MIIWQITSLLDHFVVGAQFTTAIYRFSFLCSGALSSSSFVGLALRKIKLLIKSPFYNSFLLN